MPRSGKAIEALLGTKVVRVSFKELHAAYERADKDQAAKWADLWIKAAEKVIEPAREEIVKSGAMYLGMKELLRRRNAQAITINCLGGYYGGHIKAYPCLGFTQLNNDGLVGACESDVRSTITMLAIGTLSRRPGYISDPVIDTAKRQVIYAHCVAPTKVFGPAGASNPYHIRSHSEDRRGAAMRSLLPLGYMTTTLELHAGRKQFILHQGKSVENIDEDKACRTKLAAEVKGDIEKLFNYWDQWGWHRVTFYGDLKPCVQELAKALKMRVIEEA
jgi:L-fucose isomerase-like protein